MTNTSAPLLSGLIFLVLTLVAWPAYAADRIEIIELKQRSAEELIPILQPLMDKRTGLSGHGYKLLVRASGAELARVRALVKELDQAARTLLISVREASHAEIEREELAAAVAMKKDTAGTRIEAHGHIHSTRTRDDGHSRFQVRALEGQPAFISSGLRFPVVGFQYHEGTQGGHTSPTIRYEEVSSGFYALARLSGNDKDPQCVVDISPQRETLLGQDSADIRHTRLHTQVRGAVGEWIELGGTGEDITREGSGGLHYSQGRESQRSRLWLRVQTLDE